MPDHPRSTGRRAYFQVRLSEREYAAFEREAQTRGLSPSLLMTRIVKVMARDDLWHAVLDTDEASARANQPKE